MKQQIKQHNTTEERRKKQTQQYIKVCLYILFSLRLYINSQFNAIPPQKKGTEIEKEKWNTNYQTEGRIIKKRRQLAPLMLSCRLYNSKISYTRNVISASSESDLINTLGTA